MTACCPWVCWRRLAAKRAEAAQAKTTQTESGYTVTGEGDPAIDALVLARYEAKKRKNFAEADRIRDELKAQGIRDHRHQGRRKLEAGLNAIQTEKSSPFDNGEDLFSGSPLPVLIGGVRHALVPESCHQPVQGAPPELLEPGGPPNHFTSVGLTA